MKLSNVLCAIALTSTTAFAGAVSDVNLSGKVGLTSDYVYRGISQTNGNMAAQAFIEAEYSNFYVNAFGSNVDFGNSDSTNLELTTSAGYRYKPTDFFTLDMGMSYAAYPGSKSVHDQDYMEFHLKGDYDLSFVKAGGSVNYSPRYTSDLDQTTYLEGHVSAPIGMGFEVGAAAGLLSVTQAEVADVWDYRVFVTKNIGKFSMTANWYDNSAKDVNSHGIDLFNQHWGLDFAYNF